MANRPTVQDVLRQFYPRYLEKYTSNDRQAKKAVHTLNRKTGTYQVVLIIFAPHPMSSSVRVQINHKISLQILPVLDQALQNIQLSIVCSLPFI